MDGRQRARVFDKLPLRSANQDFRRKRPNGGKATRCRRPSGKRWMTAQADYVDASIMLRFWQHGAEKLVPLGLAGG